MTIFPKVRQSKVLIFGVVFFALAFGMVRLVKYGSKPQKSGLKVAENKSINKKVLRFSSETIKTANDDRPAKELSRIERLVPESTQEIPEKRLVVVAWQPSHQDDTGKDWHEYEICGDIIDKAINKATKVQNVKCWDLNHGLTGSNNYRPSPTNTIAFDAEIEQANQAGATYFISIHNDGGAPSGVLGEYLPGDDAGKKFAEELVNVVCVKTGLPNRGLRPVSLYSIESPRNKTQYKCLLEIGDNVQDRAFLENSNNREMIAQALAEVVNGYAE